MPAQQYRWFIATIPHHCFLPWLPPGVDYLRGQLERGEETGYLHWQFVVHLPRKSTIATLRKIFGPYHFQPTRSAAANEYCNKPETSVPNTQFELGKKPINRNNAKEWEEIWESATRGDFISIPADIRIRSYNTLRKIASDYAEPKEFEKEVYVFWGKTGTGKSRRAWAEATRHAYPKDPRTKWWDGYQGHEHVVIDEFDGTIDICHMLRWLDRYPVLVEIKGAAVPLKANKIWITSNMDPRTWYEGKAKLVQIEALMRRIKVTHFNNPFE